MWMSVCFVAWNIQLDKLSKLWQTRFVHLFLSPLQVVLKGLKVCCLTMLTSSVYSCHIEWRLNSNHIIAHELGRVLWSGEFLSSFLRGGFSFPLLTVECDCSWLKRVRLDVCTCFFFLSNWKISPQLILDERFLTLARSLKQIFVLCRESSSLWVT